MDPAAQQPSDGIDQSTPTQPNSAAQMVQSVVQQATVPQNEQPQILIAKSQAAQSSTAKERAESNDQIRKLGEKIDSVNLPTDLKENLIERISRLALLRASAGFMSANYILEYENTASYVNWVVGLPWNSLSQDLLDLVKAKEALDKNHYGLEQIKSRILDYLATVILNLKNNKPENVIHAPILCLVGLAGTGKTTLAQSIAEALGKQFQRIPFGGMADSRSLRGQSRAFPDAEPGSVIKKLNQAKTRNPVILLDELDRVSEAARADIMGVLVELLDPEQNVAFTDHYIDYPFNLSNVLFIATANNTTVISTAVMDRLEIIQMPSYTDEEKIVIAKSYLFPKIRAQAGLQENQISIDDTIWSAVIRPLGFDSGIRSLERTIDNMCRKVARQIVEGKAQAVRITGENIKQFLPSW
ncbi:MAG TPA: AAA family ATPase [Patescibacteria group bacterium]|nr:AAA family ATPase [Patescibacteria group bacterium]